MCVVHGNYHLFKGIAQSQMEINFPFSVFSDRGVHRDIRGHVVGKSFHSW